MPATKASASAELLEVSEPRFLSMVRKPANKTAFKVVRSDVEEGETAVAKPTVLRRTRRSEVQPIMALRFPAGTTDESVNDRLKAFRMDGYSVTSTEEGVLALRSDLKSISKEDTQEITLTDDGVVAVVAKTAAAQQNPKSELAIVSLEFRSDVHSTDTVQKWLTENGFDAAEVSAPDSADDGGFVVTRSEVPEGEESRRLDLGNGITAVVIRADVAAVPAHLLSAVYDTAYGNWGWGHLDFAASMADRNFCEQVDEANDRLRSVLNNILYYSSYSIADRKALVQNSLAQYGEFMASLMDSLPQQVMTAAVRSDLPKLEKTEMNAPAQNSGAPTNPAAAVAGATQETQVTRAEFTQLANGMAALIARLDKALPAPEPEVDPNAPITRADLTTVVAAAAAAAVKEAMAPVTEAQTQLATRMDTLTGATAVVRNDSNPDQTVVVKPAEGETKDKDVFRNCSPFGAMREFVKTQQTA